MAVSIIAKPNTDAPAGGYLYGSIRDNNGTNNGTPVNAAVYQDFHQFFARMMAMGNVTFNDLPDEDNYEWQYQEALEQNIAKFASVNVITANLPTSLFGTLVVGNSATPITATLVVGTAGDIGKKITFSNVNTGTLTIAAGAGQNIFPVLGSPELNIYQGDSIELTYEASGVWVVTRLHRFALAAEAPAFANSWASSGTYTFSTKSEGGMVHLKGVLTNTYALALNGAKMFTLSTPPTTARLVMAWARGDIAGEVFPVRLTFNTNGDVLFSVSNLGTTPAIGENLELHLDGISIYKHF
jgi:hypothetical protein